MVIQPNMSPKAITEVWENTKDIFERYDIPLSEKSLEILIGSNPLSSVLKELNSFVGSSTATCIEGG